VLAGRGKVFCAGADLNWMKRMGELDFEENRKGRDRLRTMLNRLHALAKPTVARVHGAAFAGGMGLIAACDMAIASTDTEFCVSEVRLGLTPATISPYVSPRWASAPRAAISSLPSAFRRRRRTASASYRSWRSPLSSTRRSTRSWASSFRRARGARVTKDLIRAVAGRRVDSGLMDDMAARIATARASAEGKEGVRAFLEKRKPAWLQQAMKRAPRRRNKVRPVFAKILIATAARSPVA